MLFDNLLWGVRTDMREEPIDQNRKKLVLKTW